jgi:FAD/FMN-containing dehydrogenase
VDALNEHVIKDGGRIYLAKDQFTRADHFRAMETRLPSFEAVRAKWDPNKRFKSAQSVRLFGD